MVYMYRGNKSFWFVRQTPQGPLFHSDAVPHGIIGRSETREDTALVLGMGHFGDPASRIIHHI